MFMMAGLSINATIFEVAVTDLIPRFSVIIVEDITTVTKG